MTTQTAGVDHAAAGSPYGTPRSVSHGCGRPQRFRPGARSGRAASAMQGRRARPLSAQSMCLSRAAEMLVWAPEQGSRGLSGAAGRSAPVHGDDVNPDRDSEALRKRLRRRPRALPLGRVLGDPCRALGGARTRLVHLSRARQDDDVAALTIAVKVQRDLRVARDGAKPTIGLGPVTASLPSIFGPLPSVARGCGSAYFAVFERPRFATGCHRLRPLGSINAPCPVAATADW
jgi:hypothetical protein